LFKIGKFTASSCFNWVSTNPFYLQQRGVTFGGKTLWRKCERKLNDQNTLNELEDPLSQPEVPLSLSLPGFSSSVFTVEFGSKNRPALHHFQNQRFVGTPHMHSLCLYLSP